MILHRDTSWLVVDKPCGLATHAGGPGELGVVEWLELHLGLTTHVVSRLDRETSGALLLAVDAAASARAEAIHDSGRALKVYEFYSASDVLDAGGNPEWERDEPLEGKPAHTVFRRLGRTADGKAVRYRAEIKRGRRHQIRRHAADSGLPLLGDTEYGGAAFTRLMLHCTEVHWPEIAAPLLCPAPASFLAVAQGSDPGFACCRDRRGEWLPAITDAFRAVHRDEIDGLPAAVDVYGAWLSAAWFDETASVQKIERLLHPVLEQAAAAYGCRGGVIRTHRRNPHQQGLVTETGSWHQAPPDTFTVTEHGLRYEVNLTRTQHTGLFLDQRDSRRRVAAAASGRRLANLFAFTCSFAVAAAAAGAEVAFSIDTARACLATGMNNFSLNRLEETGRGKFIQEDVRKWLRRQLRRKADRPDVFRPLDLVVCDPPVFAATKDGGRFALEKEWPHLADAVADLLAPDGQALFANNHRTGDHGFYRRALEDRFAQVVDLRPPLDFPVFTGRPHHVRTFWCSR